MDQSANHPVLWVVVEDNLGHAKLLKKCMQRFGITNPILHFTAGEPAIEYLLYEGRGEAQLLILDLNLPLMHGSEVARQIRGELAAEQLPIFVSSTTLDEQEVIRCNEVGCQGYIKKPVDEQVLDRAITSLGESYYYTHDLEGRRCLNKKA